MGIYILFGIIIMILAGLLIYSYHSFNKSMAAMESVAIENEQLLKLRETVLEIAGKVAKSRDSSELYQYILEACLRMIPKAKFGNILVFNSDGYLTPKASVGFNRDEGDIKLKLEESVLNTATGGKLDSTVIANTMDDILNKKDQVSPASSVPDIRSEASTPLYIDGDVVGLLCINSAEKDIFSERDIYILEYASNLISIVLKDQKTNGENLHLSRYDSLSRLPNRASFDRELIRLLNDPSKDVLNLYFILMDLNQLKLVNEKLGHRAGDEIIQKFSDILRRHLGKNDFCGRYGGDEFVAVIQGDSVLVNHILDGIAKELAENKKIINDMNFTPGFRHGKASFKEGKASMDLLYALADLRMNEPRREKSRRFLDEDED